jgi:glycerol-3-phosphate O-acyltransferase
MSAIKSMVADPSVLSNHSSECALVCHGTGRKIDDPRDAILSSSSAESERLSSPALSLRPRWRRLLRRCMLLPVRYEVQAAAAPPSGGKLCYVVETDRLEDRVVLEDLCRSRGWRAPQPEFPSAGSCGVWSLRRPHRWFTRRSAPRDLAEPAASLVLDEAAAPHAHFVPVAVYWGRAPGREHSLIKLLLSEDWGLSGRVRRLFAVLFHGRDVLIKVGEALPAAELREGDLDPDLVERRLGRVLRVFFNQQRTSTVGPDLSHRRLLVDEVLASPLVADAISRERRASPRTREQKIKARARSYVEEIAADYSYPVVRTLDRAFHWLWNRLYDGLDVRHLDSVSGIASGTELVYVPCHRSHIDYMLLAYVIYRSGLAPPHIAAGVNLDLPLVGTILRRGGAFYIRRTFRGNALYAAVFRSYFQTILARGFPVKYFIEGTRSRTGRLLAPKLGLLTMTIESYLRDRGRPIVFVPVYFGYEKLIEGPTFIGELQGQRKRQETLSGFLRSLTALRQRFGRVQVSFSRPIALDVLLDELRPGWRETESLERLRPDWLPDVAEVLGRRILTAINDAAVVNAVNLVALVVLSMPKQTLVEAELIAQLELYLALSKAAPYSDRSGSSDSTPAEMIGRCEAMGWLTRSPRRWGDILMMDERTAVLASYYRNNIVHLFALPALIASVFNNRTEIGPEQLCALVGRLYPCFRRELYLRLTTPELPAECDRICATLVELGVLEVRGGRFGRPGPASGRAAQLRLCAELVLPFLERYFLGVGVLLGEGSGRLRRGELIDRCVDAAEQLSLIFSLNAPDLFNRGLFENLLSNLGDLGIVSSGTGGTLSFAAAPLEDLAAALAATLPPQLRQTLVNLAGLALRPRSGAGTG